MINPELKAITAEQASLSGDLSLHKVAHLLPQGLALLALAPKRWQLDMAAVTQVSSAAVALLLEWLAAAERADQRLEIINVPEALLPMIEISDLEPIFAPIFRP